MKIKIAVILLLYSFSLKAQNINDGRIKEYLSESQTLMKLLSIKTRENVNKDGLLVFKAVSTREGMDAKFLNPPNKVAYFNGDMNTRFYLHPYIEMSNYLYSIIFNNKPAASTLEFFHAKSVIVHELTHYFQRTYTPLGTYIELNLNRSNEAAHYSQPVEFESYTVSAYYFLNQYNNTLLKSIINKPTIKDDCKRRTLINNYLSIVFPKDNDLHLLKCY